MVRMPSMPTPEAGSVATLKAHGSFYRYHFKKASPGIQGFLQLLTHTKVVPVALGQVGHTWLELFLLSLMASPHPLANVVNRSATATK
eukprot:8299594-Karenia_brevis.AAC.1